MFNIDNFISAEKDNEKRAFLSQLKECIETSNLTTDSDLYNYLFKRYDTYTKELSRMNRISDSHPSVKYIEEKMEILATLIDELTPCEDKVNHPSHYTWLKEKCGIEVIDITRHMDFDLGNAVKYVLRCGHKSEKGYSDKEKTIEDLQKAIWYINDKIKTIENGD